LRLSRLGEAVTGLCRIGAGQEESKTFACVPTCRYNRRHPFPG
jgi:hypothetical protein